MSIYYSQRLSYYKKEHGLKSSNAAKIAKLDYAEFHNAFLKTLETFITKAFKAYGSDGETRECYFKIFLDLEGGSNIGDAIYELNSISPKIFQNFLEEYCTSTLVEQRSGKKINLNNIIKIELTEQNENLSKIIEREVRTPIEMDDQSKLEAEKRPLELFFSSPAKRRKLGDVRTTLLDRLNAVDSTQEEETAPTISILNMR